MELLESNSPKSELIKKSLQQRKALEEEVRQLSDRTEKMIINTVVIGGALALSYWIVKSFISPGKRSKAKKRKSASLVAEPTVEEDREESKISEMLSSVGTMLASQAAGFLLAIAKEKLMEYLASQAEKKNETK